MLPEALDFDFEPRLIIPGIDDDGIATLHNVKDLAQYTKTVDNLLKGECPFCVIDTDLNPILHETDRWRVFHSAFPQKSQTLHLVIPHHDHRRNLADLTVFDYTDFGLMMEWIHENFPEIKGGGLTLRHGDSWLHSGSVPGHLHFNLQEPNGTGRVQVTLCKTPEEIKDKTKILLVFEKIRLGTPVEELSEAERKLVEGRL